MYHNIALQTQVASIKVEDNILRYNFSAREKYCNLILTGLLIA